MTTDLERLLDSLNHPGHIAVCERSSGIFTGHIVDVTDASAMLERYAGGDVWISVARLDPSVTTGRGKASDIRSLSALPIDLDVKPSGMPTWDATRDVITTLSALLNAEPVAIVNTGHGLQPWFGLDVDDPAWHCDSADDPRWMEIQSVVRRWGRLVSHIAQIHGGNADTVFDLARVLRCPGSVNVKNPDAPIPVTVEQWCSGTPISAERLIEQLNAYGITEQDSDRQTPGEVLAPACEWEWAERTCNYTAAMLEAWASDTPGTSGRHPWLVSSATRLAAAHRYGCITESDHARAVQTLARRFTNILSDLALGDPRKVAPGEIPDALAWGIARTESMTTTVLANQLGDHKHRATPAHLNSTIPELITQLRTWLDLPDPSHVLATLAVAATSDLDGDPVWLMNVAPPSSGKTEAVRLLDDIATGHLDDVTAPGLISWSAGKDPKPQGVLVRMGPRGLLTFGDLSSLLATSDRGGRDQVFALLRRVYDGHASRSIAAPGGRTAGALEWSGRATVVAAVTGAIDNYSAHSDKLGPRWLYIRLTGRDTASRRRAARAARQGDTDAHRATCRAYAAAIVRQARAVAATVEIPTAIEDAIEDAALVTCWGRASVPRSGYGRKDPEGPPEVEDPPRLIRQALMLSRGLLALGLDADSVETIARRCILDSMPATRRSVLETLAAANGELLPTAEVARRSSLHRHVTRIALEDLEVVGAVMGKRDSDGEDDDEDREDRRRRLWALAPHADGQLVADVLEDHSRSVARWHEMWEVPTPPPQIETPNTPSHINASHISCHSFTPPTQADLSAVSLTGAAS